MRTRFPTLRPQAIAAAALCAGSLFAASAAQAALIVTSATRSISADTSLSDVAANSSNTTSGLFAGSVVSRGAGNPPADASANQFTHINPLSFFGIGEARVDLRDGATGEAESALTLFFTLTSSFSFSGFAQFIAEGNATPRASFELDDDLGGAALITGSDSAPLAPFSGTLVPGNYSLNLRASGNSIDPNEFAFANFAFNLTFVELGELPPADVPEPHSLALALAGVLACGAARRRQPRGAAVALKETSA